jgi:hypothetical protein
VCVKVAIDRFIAETNADPKPFVWIAPPSRILAAVKQGIARVPNVMVVHPSFPAKTVPEFIAYVKANPRKVTMASAGVGSTSHMAGELFKNGGTCRIADKRPRLPTCSAAKCWLISLPCRRRSGSPRARPKKVSCIFGPRRWISAAGDVDYETSYSLKCRPTQRMF